MLPAAGHGVADAPPHVLADTSNSNVENLEERAFWYPNSFNGGTSAEGKSRSASLGPYSFVSGSGAMTAQLQFDSMAITFLPVATLTKPSSPMYRPQLFRTCQYSTPFSTPHPTTLTTWSVSYCLPSHVRYVSVISSPRRYLPSSSLPESTLHVIGPRPH